MTDGVRVLIIMRSADGPVRFWPSLFIYFFFLYPLVAAAASVVYKVQKTLYSFSHSHSIKIA